VKKKARFNLLVVAGASGGHIFPALGFIDTLKSRQEDFDILLVLPQKRISNPLLELKYKLAALPVSPIKFSLDPGNLIAIFNFFRGAFKSMYILLKFKPCATVAFGSIVSIPVVICSWLLRIKTIIHEQNVVAGRANRFLAAFSNKIAVSFKETKDYFSKYKNKVVLTGNPVRKELEYIQKRGALDFFGFTEDKVTILVAGGSQGSHSINLAFLKAVSGLSAATGVQVIHLAGKKDYDWLKNSYQSLNIGVKLFDFLEAMHYAYCAADFAVTRAGATTIAELLHFCLPAIVIPYPYAYRHQAANAGILEKLGTAILVKDNQLDSGAVGQVLAELLNNPQKVKNMRLGYDNIRQADAGNLISEQVLRLI